MDHYFFDGHVHSQLTLGQNTRCIDSEGCSILYHQNGLHGHTIIYHVDLGENSNTWRENDPWIYANNRDAYILIVNCGLPNHWVCCNGDLEYSGCFGTTTQGVRNTVHQHGQR